MMSGKLSRLMLVAALCLAGVAHAQDALLGRARQLIDSRQARAAYELLAPLEQQRAGEPEFDYLLGVAALDVGEHTRAVFALERVLAVRPDHPQARAEIARAYFLMGEDRTARSEFETVKRMSPPAEAAAAVERFLDALDGRERARGTGITGFLEATFGQDENVNAATGSTQFAVPLFPGLMFNVAPAATRQRDTFWNLGGGANGRYAINNTVGLIGNASFDMRMNSSRDQFDTGSLSGGAGVSVKRDADEFVAGFQGQSYGVDNTRFRDVSGAVGQWRRAIGTSDQVTAYAQHSRLTYPGQNARNAMRTVFGGGWAHQYAGPRSPVAFIGVYAGNEDPTGQNVPHFGHDLTGGRIGGQIGLTDKLTLTASLAYEERRYGGPDPLFLVNRRDKDTQMRIGASYAFARNWSITPAVSYGENRSNIVVNAYNRTMISIGVRHDFR